MEGTTSSDAGAYIRDGIKSIATFGVCKEVDWPYDISQFAVKPSQTCYDSAIKYVAVSYFKLDTNLDELKSCLAAGYPFVFGFTVYESFPRTPGTNGIVPMPGNEHVIGGHAVLAVGYSDNNQWFIIRNSWGQNYGDQGHYYMPYQYLTSPSLSNDFWTVRTVSTAAFAPYR
jgi:C1A family cysteine protease